MKPISPGPTFAWMAACLLMATGCSSPPTRYYVLSTLQDSRPPLAHGAPELAVGVGPLELPDYLDRPQIVTRSGLNELDLAEFDRWAEPLKDNVAQVLAENLAALLPSKKVSVYPWKRATPLDVQLAVKITRFDLGQGGEAVLDARWALLRSSDGRELLASESHHREKATGTGYRATVAALNRTLGQFSREIALAIAAQSGARPMPD